jgi:polysaccharide deacetylase 2 family uncharacterized protein YibQ
VVAAALHQAWQRDYLQRLFTRPQKLLDYCIQADQLDEAIRLCLDDLGASPIFVIQTQEDLQEENRRWRFRHLTARVSDQISLLRCNLALTAAVQSAGGEILSGQQAPGGGRLTLELGVDGLRTHLLEVILDKNIVPTRGRLALVIDDFGAINNQVAEEFLNLPIQLTVAVIPGHPTSGLMARKAKDAGHEVFLHLPMEPKDGQVGEENAILVDLPADEIRRRVRWALAEIPQASGVNNHMGSLATENQEVMRVVLEEIKAAGKFFLDSRTSSQSVAPEVAADMGLLCAASEGFLDYQDESEEVKKSLETLAEKALKDGTAIGIGHIKAHTLEVLREMIPQLERKGVRFVHVSRLLTIRQQQ